MKSAFGLAIAGQLFLAASGSQPAAAPAPAAAAATPTPDGKSADTKIRRVTVYSDRARITRTGSIALSDGRQRILVSGLPHDLLSDSVSAALPGKSAAKILSIEVEESFGKRTNGKAAQDLLDQQEAMQKKLQAVQDDLTSLGAEEAFLRGFQVHSKTDDKGKPLPLPLEPASWQQTLAFVTDSLDDVLARTRAKQAEQRELYKQAAALQVEIDKVRSYETEAAKTVALEIEDPKAESVDLEVTYTIAGPSWRPAYDVRVLSSTGKIEVVTHGVVRQSTGEDWKDVDVTFSTAFPQQGADVPELLAWRLGDTQQYALASQNGLVAALGPGAAVDKPAPVPMPVSAPSRADRTATKHASRDRKAEVSLPEEETISVTGVAPGVAQGSDDYDGVPSLAKTDENEPDDAGAIGGEGGGYGIAEAPQGSSSGYVMNGVNVTAAPTPAPITIRQMNENVWSLPAGHAFTFRNDGGESFHWQGDVLYCPSPRVSAGGFDYGFKPEHKQTVLSDGRERKVKLASATFPAQLQYEVVAPISTRAYLRATMTNDSRKPFLAGESFVFLDDDFVGRAFIDTVAGGEKLDLSLGVDDAVKVDRKLEQTAENKGILIGKKERTVYTILLTVKSFKKRPIDVLLRDQMPITWQKDDISIDKIGISPDPWVELGADGKPVGNPDDGRLAFKLKVDPGQKASIKIQYAVERPREFEMTEQRRSL